MGMTFRTIKEIPAENGKLFFTKAGERHQLADFNGYVEIREATTIVSILGTVHKGDKKIYASFIICNDMDYKIDMDDFIFMDAIPFDATADVLGKNFRFSGLKYEDSDPIKGIYTFEIPDAYLLQKLLQMDE